MELWKTNFENELYNLKDEVFSGTDLIPNTGISYKNVCTPLSDNINQTVGNSKLTPFLEINTIEKTESFYYTRETEKIIENGIEYVVLTNSSDGG